MPRLETGPYRPAEDDWQGVFIRGDDAAAYAHYLRSVMQGTGGDQFTQAVVEALVTLLESCRE